MHPNQKISFQFGNQQYQVNNAAEALADLYLLDGGLSTLFQGVGQLYSLAGNQPGTPEEAFLALQYFLNFLNELQKNTVCQQWPAGTTYPKTRSSKAA